MSDGSSPLLHWVEPGPGCLRLTINTSLYPETCVFRTCYVFTDRAYLYLRTETSHEIIVEFRSKQNQENLHPVIGDFCNELVNQRIRLDLAAETQSIRQMIVAQAFSEADFDEPH